MIEIILRDKAFQNHYYKVGYHQHIKLEDEFAPTNLKVYTLFNFTQSENVVT